MKTVSEDKRSLNREKVNRQLIEQGIDQGVHQDKHTKFQN